MAYDAKSPNAVELARQWVSAYPSADSWHNAIAIYRNLNHPDARAKLDLLRLRRRPVRSRAPATIMLYADQAADQVNYNEAKP